VRWAIAGTGTASLPDPRAPGLAFRSVAGGFLVQSRDNAETQGGDLKLLKPSSQVLNLLQITKLTGVFDVQQDEAAAIQSFSKGGAGATA